ncbi:MAG: heme A synthase [Chloroflexi bacterium]|nr:heme A synthase [Chloroflexota bacterium]
MIQQRTPGKRIHLVFRVVAVAALVAAFTQVTLGGVVRVTGSGLGCPDWPLCHGQIIPPFEIDTLIEYTHRLSASVLSFLMLATAGMAWVYYRSNPWIVISSVAGLALVVIAAVLGGATVLTELAWWVRLIHLAVAEGVVAAMVIVSVAGWRTPEQSSAQVSDTKEADGFNRLILTTIAGVFLLILSGSYMVGYGAGSSCATWPLCNGSLFPQGAPYAIHMGHRLLSALVGVLIIATVVAANSRRRQQPELRWAGMILATVFVIQIMVGAGTVWMGFAPYMKAMHLSIATLVWIALMFLATLVYSRQRLPFRSVEPNPGRTSELEGLTS